MICHEEEYEGNAAQDSCTWQEPASYLSMVVHMRPPPEATLASTPFSPSAWRSLHSVSISGMEVPSSQSRPSVSVCTRILFTPLSAACKASAQSSWPPLGRTEHIYRASLNHILLQHRLLPHAEGVHKRGADAIHEATPISY